MSTPCDVPAGFRVVELSREPIELYKVLKFEGLSESGGLARAAVASGKVSVNGAVEIQKRKKIVSGDRIEFGDHRILVRLGVAGQPDADPEKAKETGDRTGKAPPAGDNIVQ